MKLTFAYDFMGRRYSKKVYIYDTQVSDFTLQVSSSFLYNGWNMIHETTTPQSLALPVTRSYVWGLDLSQTLQGAGGVGGLLCSVHSPQGGSAATYYATADANGNITDYINASGTTVASYTFDAFGQVVNESIAQGLEPNVFPHRFSSKYQDLETDLNYYGLRYYSADMGRWLNRDPIGEYGGVNLYSMLSNMIVNDADYLGLSTINLNFGSSYGSLGNDIIDAGIGGSIDHLNDALDSCCTIYNIGCDVKISATLHGSNNNISVDPKDDDDIYNRLQHDFDGDGIPILIVPSYGSSGVDAAAFGNIYYGVGGMVSSATSIINRGTLTHELGHIGGYVAPEGQEVVENLPPGIAGPPFIDPYHNNDINQIMSPEYTVGAPPATGVDKNLCCALEAVAE